MRSVFARILVWCAVMLVFSAAGFTVVQILLGARGGGPTGYFARVNLAAFAEARGAYESGGRERLRQTLDGIDRVLLADYRLLDAGGVDLASGEDLSRKAGLGRSRLGNPGHSGDDFFLTAVSSDGRYQLLTVFRMGKFDFWLVAPYFAVILGGLALLCWALAANIASPLRRLTAAVARFGGGDLRARVNSKRKDEIGKLSGAFDRMADRIETLLTAERRLLQDISHELRTPLSRLSFAAELIPSGEDPSAAAAKVKKEVHRMASLVGALVEMTRAEGDSSVSVREEVRLDALLREIVEDCRVEADGRGCEFALAADCDRQFWGDPELLRRAFENVIRNAVKYSPAGQRVEIHLDADSAAARVRVRDFGQGVPEEHLTKIFQPFYRVDSARGASTGGEGLGLAIAQRSIALHHGTITARNMDPGLEVSIELPFSAAAAKG